MAKNSMAVTSTDTDPKKPRLDKKAIVIGILAVVAIALAFWLLAEMNRAPPKSPPAPPLVPNAEKK